MKIKDAKALAAVDRDISAIMRRVRAVNTVPEAILRKALRKRGLRFGVNAKTIAGKPDFIFKSKRLVVFVDGDFWHGGQWRKRRLSALEQQFRLSSNRTYWLRKIRNNMRRDCKHTTTLLCQGFTVLRFWESDVVRIL